ncbi:MAG TPA: hypothetical protein VEK79_02760 [Thermoanaerobaculia bacterium]|nr:hypothetical protein [Thermoanaerobaculia bacterium]
MLGGITDSETTTLGFGRLFFVTDEFSEAYQPWLRVDAVDVTPPASIEETVWKDLVSRYALINREAVKIPAHISRRGETAAPFMVSLSRPAFSTDRSLALLTYATSWQGHGTVAAMVLRWTPEGWKHVATVALIGA